MCVHRGRGAVCPVVRQSPAAASSARDLWAALISRETPEVDPANPVTLFLYIRSSFCSYRGTLILTEFWTPNASSTGLTIYGEIMNSSATDYRYGLHIVRLRVSSDLVRY